MAMQVDRFQWNEGTARLSCRVQSEGLPETLWFDLDPPTPPSAANWAAVALLYPAMVKGEDMEIDQVVSPRLLFNLNNDVQALLRIYYPSLCRIRIDARPDTATPCGSVGRVGTGFSGGVDSFATLALYGSEKAPPGFRATDLAVFDVGAFGHTGEPEVDALFQRAVEKASVFASAKGYGAITVASNLDAFFAAIDVRFQKSHTLRNVAAALTLENLLDAYLYSSAYGPRDIRVAEGLEIAHMDSIVLPLLATERMALFSAGSGITRFEKTRLIAQSEDARQMLDVCIMPAKRRQLFGTINCSKCWKCARTMATLDALRMLDQFGAVFNVPFYRAHRGALLDVVALRALSGSKVDAEAVELGRAAGLPFRSESALRAKMRVNDVRRWLRSVRSKVAAQLI